MQNDMSIISLITEASLVVQIVMAVLFIASFISWIFIVQKHHVLNRAVNRADRFEDDFWSGGNLRELYVRVKEDKKKGGVARIFEAGFKEYLRQSKSAKANPDRLFESVQRQMRITLSREIDALETNLNFLATVGSTSPYIGLFGTVWGIMNSFRALGDVQQATLSMVAPGIAEALVATAMGLFAAIPAVIAYNRFSGKLDRLINRYSTFSEEFSTLIQRQIQAAASQSAQVNAQVD